MTIWRGLTRPAHYAALVAGAVPVLAFPSPNLEDVAWFGLVPGLLIFRAAPNAREAAVRGWWFGTGYLLAALYWLVPNLGPGLLAVVIVLGAPWAGVGLAAWRLLRPDDAAPRRWRPAVRQALTALVVVPSSWVVVDWIRSWQGIGGPWAVYGASQWQHPAILALAALGGIWLVSFMLVVANTGFAIALTAATTAARVAGLVAAGVAIGAGPVAFALTAPPPSAGRVTIALVQQGLQPNQAAGLAAESRYTLRSRGAGLIVWGESSIGSDLDTHTHLLARLERLSASVGADLLVSQDAITPAGAKRKVAILIGPAGIEGSYVKTRLVPFGEYIPFRSALGWLDKISRAAPRNMVPGTGAHTLVATLAGGRPLPFGVLICFESSFPDMSRVDADRGAQVILYQTSDSTFQGSWAPEQHAALAAVRAAETGRPALQAALTGDSAAFDARGRLLAWAGTNFSGIIEVPVQLTASSDRTPYDQLGDYVPWTAVGIAGIALLSWLRLPSRFRRSGRPANGGARGSHLAPSYRINHRASGGILSTRFRGATRHIVLVAKWPAKTQRLAKAARRNSVPEDGKTTWRLRPVLIAICAAGLLLATACQSGPGSTAGGGSGPTPSSGSSAQATQTTLAISPASGSHDVNPSQGISVIATGGKITSVHVSAGGNQVAGIMNASSTSWHSSWALPVSQRITVTATGTDSAGRTVTRTSSFRTLSPARTFATHIFEGYQDTYGVGMPIMLTFSAPITNRKAVERALSITTSKPVTGAWSWDGNQAVSFRPRGYWPANTEVSFTGHLNGVEGAPGVYGYHTLTQSFRIGTSLIVVASTRTHRLKLYQGGKLIRNWPISSGRPGDNTPNGTYLTIEKANPVRMTGPGYSLLVPWSVRFTWSGDYLHDAYWSVGEQGFTNVSHGCVNMAPADAEFYYKLAVPGDPVTITGSPRGGVWDNGWTQWFLSWPQFLSGSALHQAVQAGPSGSTFVDPATLTAATASAPLQTSALHNSRGG